MSALLLAELTTLRLGGPAREVVRVSTEDELVDTVRALDAHGAPLILVGGGSNLVVPDDGFAGTVVLVETRGVEHDGDDVTSAAGEHWDDVVAAVVADGRVGVEALSGIPGLVGATPVQNVGAYGQDIAQTFLSARVLHRPTGDVRRMERGDCGFAYRTSVFKQSDEYVVLSVTLRLPRGSGGTPVAYAALAAHLGVEVGATAPADRVREAVLDLRRARGMVLDPADHDTWSAGSFFTNPVVDPEVADRIPDAARWPADEGVKLSAAWLIEHAGFGRGYRSTAAPGVSVSTKHTLALTNRGTGTTAALLTLAREIGDGVRDRFGVALTPEPTLLAKIP